MTNQRQFLAEGWVRIAANVQALLSEAIDTAWLSTPEAGRSLRNLVRGTRNVVIVTQGALHLQPGTAPGTMGGPDPKFSHLTDCLTALKTAAEAAAADLSQDGTSTESLSDSVNAAFRATGDIDWAVARLNLSNQLQA